MNRRHLTTKDRAAIFAASAGACHICGGKIGVGEAWDADHPIPLALGGDDSPGALRAAHVKCHRTKTSADVAQIAKAKRVGAKHTGTFRASRNALPGGKGSRFKKKIGGQVEVRDDWQSIGDVARRMVGESAE